MVEAKKKRNEKENEKENTNCAHNQLYFLFSPI